MPGLVLILSGSLAFCFRLDKFLSLGNISGLLKGRKSPIQSCIYWVFFQHVLNVQFHRMNTARYLRPNFQL